MVTVSDEGVGFVHPAADPGGGFGLQLMCGLADTEIHSEAGQTRVAMRFQLRDGDSPQRP